MMSPHFKMGNVRVSCEGYEDHGDQQHVLQGSCGVSRGESVCVCVCVSSTAISTGGI